LVTTIIAINDDNKNNTNNDDIDGNKMIVRRLYYIDKEIPCILSSLPKDSPWTSPGIHGSHQQGIRRFAKHGQRS